MLIIGPFFLLKMFRNNNFMRLKELLQSQWLSPSMINSIQEEKFLRLIEYCRNNVPYYKKIEALNKIKGLDDIAKIPFLTKKIIKQSYEELKAFNLSERYFVKNSTSGSTGESLRFLSPRRNPANFGILTRGNMWTGWNLGNRQVFLWGSRYDMNQFKKISNMLKNTFIHKILYLSSFNMRDKDMLVYRERINRYKPQLITGYANSLFIFADFLEKTGMDIYKPKGIICSGETLYDHQRDKIEAIFRCKLFNRYGSREVGNIAHECMEHSGLHINAEHVIVEILNEEGNPCRPGEQGEIVVTDLDNYVFPFIRYKIEDIGTLTDKTCKCGRGLPLIDKVEGRIFDIIAGMNGNKLTGTYWTITLRTFIKGIKTFQVIQNNKEELYLKVVSDTDFDSQEKDKLVKEILSRCGEKTKIKFEIVEDIPLTKSGKNRFIISKVLPFVK